MDTEKYKTEKNDHICLNLDFEDNLHGICYAVTAGNLRLTTGPFAPIIVDSKGNLFGAEPGENGSCSSCNRLITMLLKKE